MVTLLQALFIPIFELFRTFGTIISQWWNSLTSSLGIVVSGASILPTFWGLLPANMTGFFQSIVIVGLGATVITLIFKYVS